MRTAWVSDDAYITFRTVDNFVNGHGLRWNIAERVQAYTHPLWMWVVAAAYWWTREAYFTSIAISIGLTLATIVQLLRSARSPRSAAIGLTILLCSRAFVDYSTSGLENPLTHLLLAVFIHTFIAGSTWPSDARTFRLALLANLIMLTRLDAGLLVLPALWTSLRQNTSPHRYAWFAAGFVPLIAWELFALVYYGVPFPNTAYAKLGTGVPQHELLQQGLIYLLDSVRRDPLTLTATMGIATWALVENPRGARPIAVGIVAQLVYVVWIGGDFMSGRMLSAPLLAAVALLVAAGMPELFPLGWAVGPVAVIIGFNAFRAVFLPTQASSTALSESGVADERLYYFASNGMVNYRRGVVWPANEWARNGIQARRDHQRLIVNCCNGMLGYFAGPDVHIVDSLALADPMLSRLPAEKEWRIGHFSRAIPRGYTESILSGTNQIADPNLAAYYDRVRDLVRGTLWSGHRLRTIVRFNLGAYDERIRNAGTTAPCGYVLMSALQEVPPAGGTFNVVAVPAARQGCSWRAISSDPWVTVAGPGAGSEGASVTFTVAPTAVTKQRHATIAIAATDATSTFKILQHGLVPCRYDITPAAYRVQLTGGTFMMAVEPSDSSCAWKAESTAAWIVITGGVDNTGPGLVRYDVRPNATGGDRHGLIHVVGFASGMSSLSLTQSK